LVACVADLTELQREASAVAVLMVAVPHFAELRVAIDIASQGRAIGVLAIVPDKQRLDRIPRVIGEARVHTMSHSMVMSPRSTNDVVMILRGLGRIPAWTMTPLSEVDTAELMV